MNDILIRVFAVLAFGILLWNFTVYLSDVFIGEEYIPIKRLLIALLTTVLTLSLLQIALKVDKMSWKKLGQANISSFFTGVLLWTIPAAIGLWICLMMGWVEMYFQKFFCEHTPSDN